MIGIVLLISSATAVTYPGLRASLGLSVFNDLKQLYLTELYEQLEKSVTVNETFTHKSWLSSLTVNVTGVSLEGVNASIANSYFILDPSSQTFRCILADVNLNISFDFVHKVVLNHKGTGSIQLKNSTFTIDLKAWADSQGRVQAEIVDISGSNINVDLKFPETNLPANLLLTIGHLWPFNHIEKSLLNIVMKGICKAANPVIAKALSGITYEYQIGNTSIIVDYHVSSLNVTTQLAVEAAFNGTFYLNGTTAAYVAPVSLPAWASQDDLKLQLSEYFFDSLLQAIQQTNILTYNITQDTIPSTIPISLTTTGLKFLIPSLEQVYGPNVPVVISLSSAQAPAINITSNVVLEVFIQIAFNVLTPNSVNAFIIDWDGTTQVDMSLSVFNSTTYLVGQVISDSTEFSDMRIVSSNVGTLNTAQIQSALGWLAGNLLSYLSAYYLAVGVALPVPSSIDLAASSIYIGQGVIEVDAIPVLAN